MLFDTCFEFPILIIIYISFIEPMDTAANAAFADINYSGNSIYLFSLEECSLVGDNKWHKDIQT